MSKREIKSISLIFFTLMVLLMVSCVSAQDTSDLISDSSGDVSTTDSAVLQLSANDNVLAAGENNFTDLADELSRDDRSSLQSNAKSDESNLNEIPIAVNNEILGISNDYVLSSGNTGTFTDLRNAIDGASDTLVLNSDYKYNSSVDTLDAESWNSHTTRYADGIFIDKNITIDGAGHTINASEINRAFKIYGFNIVTIKNTIFVDGKASEGKAIYSSGDLTFDNCTFIDGDNTYDDSQAVSSGSVYQSTNVPDRCYVIVDEASYNAALANPTSVLNRYYYNNPREDGIDENGDLVSDPDTLIVGHSWNAAMHAPTSPAQTSTYPWVLVNCNGLSGEIAFNYGDEIKAVGSTLDRPYRIYSVPVDMGMTDYRLEWGTGNPGTKILDVDEVNVRFTNTFSSYTDLRNAIDATPAGGVLTLDADYKYDASVDTLDAESWNSHTTRYADGIFIDKNITIDGAGHIIDASEVNRAFKIYGFNNVTIINTGFNNGKAAEGKSIYSSGTLTIKNCTFATGNTCYHDDDAVSSGSVYQSPVAPDRCYVINDTASYNAALANPTSVLNRYYYNNPREDGIDENGDLVSDPDTLIVGHSWNAAMHAPTSPAQTSTYPWVLVNCNGLSGEIAFNYGDEIKAVGSTLDRPYRIYSVPVDMGMTDYRLEWGTGNPLDKVLDVDEVNVRFVDTYKSFTDLRNAIDATPAGGVLTLDADYAYDPVADIAAQNAVRYLDGIFINKNITIDGAGHIINASEANRALRVYGFSNLTIFNTGFVNGKGDNGKSIYSSGSLTFENCTFTTGNTCYHDDDAVDSGSVYQSPDTNVRFIVVKDKASYDAALADPTSPVNRMYYAFNREDGIDVDGNPVYDANTFIAGHSWEAAMNAPTTPAQTSTAPWIYVNLVGILDEDLVVEYDGEVKIIEHIEGPYSVKQYSVPNELYNMTDYRLEWGTGNPGTKTLDNTKVDVLFYNDVKGTYTDLQYKINTATGTLVLPYDFTYNEDIDGASFINGVVVGDDLTIDGKGYTICGNDSARVFEVTNSAVLTLSDVTVCDGNATNGGAVYVNAGSTLNANNVAFDNNTAKYRGGAIYSEGTVNIDESSFDSNNITYRKDNLDYGGAAIANMGGTLNIDHSRFTNDLRNYVVRTGDANNPQLIDGVILNAGDAKINNSYFENNSGTYGGAISSLPVSGFASETSLIVENSEFVNNLAYAGGAIYVGAGKTEFAINNCTFVGNNATGIGSYGYTSAGGAVSINRDADGTIVDSKFYNNSATVGGAVDVSATKNSVKVTIDNCDFENNTATGSPTRDAVGGAIRIHSKSLSADKLDVTVTNSNFTDNVAGTGSAIYNNGTLSLSGNKVFSDKAEIVNGEKGTIPSTINVVVLDGEVKTIDTLVADLNATVTDDNGNLIEDAKFNFTINGVEVPAVYNAASKLYEATYALPAAGIYPVNITYVTDKELVVQNGTIKTIKGTFTDLDAKMYGAISSGVLELEYNFIYTPEIDGDTLYNDGILIGGDYPLTINGNNHNISGNDTVAIFHLLDANGIITFNNITFANADCAILVASSKKLNINNCTFINNKDYYDGALDEGGAISVMGCELVIADSVFINNTGADGGAIFIDGADITVTGCVFTNNTAAGDGFDSGTGGAIYFGDAEHTLTVNNCVFTNNSASTSAATPEYVPHGGAINANGRIIITNSNFTDNDAANGSAIYSNGLLTLLGNNISTTVAEIVSGPMGKVISDVYVTVNGNKTIPAYIGDEVVLNATVTDDMGNLIEDSKFNFTVDGKEIPAVPGTGIYTADYKIAHAGETEVSVDYVVTDNLHIETGIYVAPKENATLIITTGQNNKFEYGENVTIFVTLTNDRTGEGLNDTIKVIVNNTEIPVDIINGTASFNVTGFEPGQYPITGIFDGNEIYNTPVYDSSVFEVLRPDRILSIEVEDINFGEIAVINITVTDSKGNKERGTVVLNVSGHEFVVVVDGNKSVEIAGLPIGEYSINATLVAEELDTKVVNDTEGFTVYKAASTIEINGTKAITTVENATVIVTVGPEGVTGTVNITVDGEAYGQPVEVIDGQAIVEIPRLANGTHTVTAQYTGDDNYNASEVAEMKVVVSLTPTSFEVEGKGAVYNETAYVIVSGLPKDATGTITATIDGKTFTGDAAIGIIEITGLAVGDYELFGVTYSGDSIYNATSGMASIEITPAASLVVIDPIDDVVYNASVEVTYNIENGTVKNIVVYDAYGDPITADIDNSTTGKLIISGLNAGEYTIVIYNAGDENHTESDSGATFNVNKATVTIEPVATGDKVVDGEVNITFTVPKDYDGVVTVLVDGREVTGFDIDENGTCTIPFTFDAGEHIVTVTLTDDTNYNDAVGTTTFDIAKVDPEITISDIAGNVGETVEATVTIAGGDATGYIFFNGDLYIVKDGQATIPVVIETAGMQTINVTYTGDDKYNNGTGVKAFNAGKAASTIEIDGDKEITTTEDATVIVTVGPEGVTGTVNITVDGEAYGEPVEVIDGVATVEITGLTVGNHTIAAQYTGDTNYNASEVVEMKVVVSLTPTSFEVEGKGAVYNETAYVFVSGLPEDATGTVTVTIGDKTFIADVEDGMATVEITGLAVGEYELFDVTYSGDSIYNATSGMATIVISPAASLVVIDSIEDVVYNASVEVSYAIENETEVTVNVYDADGNLIKEGITIEDDKITISGLNAGEYTIKITNAGDKNHTNSSDVETFTVNKATVTIEPVVTGDKVVDGEVNVTFTLPADVNTSSVVVTIDGMPATADLVDGTWVVSFDSLAAGNHTVVVTLTGDTNYKDAVGSATFDIAKVDPEIIIDDIVANVGDYVEVTVTIKGGDATGYLFFNGDLYPVKDGQTTIDVYIEESGIQSIGVFYFGDNKYNNGTALKEFNASKAASTIEINGTEAITTVENATVIVTVGPEGVTGTVNITVDGEAYGEPVEVIDGVATVEITGLTVGNHTIAAQYTGDTNYNASEVVEMKVVVSLTPTSFEVEGKGAVYNETAYVIVSGLPKDATGTITATIDGKTFTGDAAIGIIEITGLAVGDYELFGVTYSGDSIYNATSGMASIEITPAASFVIIDPIDDVVYNASVEVNYAIENETEITVNVYDAEGKLIKEGITIEDDKITISGLNAGKYTIKIYNAGDENHTDSFDVETFTVNKATVTIEPVVTGDKVVDGEVNITFTVPKVRDGVVNITIDGNELIGVVIDENGTCTIPGTYGAGNHTVVVILTGDTNYDDAIGSVTFEVSKVAPETSIDVDDVVAGNDVIITVTVPDDATGAVLFDIDGKTYYAEIKDGKAELVLSDLPADTYNVEYTYQGDDKYLSDSGEDSFKVSLNDTYQIKAESGAIQVGDDATIDVLLPEDAAGEVAVTVDNETYSAPVVNGKAAVTVPGLPAGDYTADVAYSGDDKYAPSSTTVDIDVAKVPNAPIDAEADPAEVGEDAVVEVTLPADATGNVTVTVNGKNYTVPVEDGKATVSVPGLPAGDYTADVAYSGDDKYEPVSTTAPISVDKVSDVPIDVSADPTEVGEDAVIEVSLPEDATGNVTVTVDGKNYTVPVENGKATVTVPELPAGEYAADVVYSGDDKYGPVSTTVPVTVNKVSDANVSANADPVEYGEDAVIEVTLPEDATGVVVASVDGELYAADVENGTATITIPNLPSGNYTTEVTYYGDDKYSPVTTTADIEVISKEEVIAPDVVKYYHGSERFIVYVLKDDKGVADKTVSITLNGVTYNRTTDENGIASLGLNINVGNYTALVKVDGTQINATVTIKSTIAADDVIKMFRNDTQYYATFYDSEGNILPNTEVTFNINGVFYTRKTNDEGVAKLNINLNPGEYIITANNPVTGEMKSNNVTVLSRIVSDDLVKYYRNASQFVVTVFGDDGNPVGAGENVTFNINGVFYTRQTNASGQAKLNINLNPGSYIITTVYKGCSQANDVEVLPVLYADDLVKTYGTSDQFKVLLVDGQGLPYPGQNITLNINGVLYNRVTGLDGYAKLNINLMPGQYIVTSSYGAAVVSNKVTVKA